MRYPERVTLTEVGPRDGLQNESQEIPLAQKIALVDALSTTGLTRIEAASFVHPKAIPQMANAAEVMAGIERRPGVTYIGLVPNEVGPETRSRRTSTRSPSSSRPAKRTTRRTSIARSPSP